MKSWHFSLIVLASLCLIYLAIAEDDITETGNNENNEEDKALSERQKRILNFFTVVRFPNSVCVSTDNLNGTCYSTEECTSRGGSSGGTCAGGYGVCCTFSLNCGGRSSENCTYLVSTGSEMGACRYEICPCNDNICQLRLDFSTFVINQPDTSTTSVTKIGGKNFFEKNQCITDQFSVTAPGNNAPPIICGTNTGEHMYVDASDLCNDIAFNLAGGTSTVTRTWNIKVTQYDCNYDNLAPDGCTQYFWGTTTDQVKSYNWDGGQHLAVQDQNICVRRERGICQICWTPTADGDFEVSGGMTGATGKVFIKQYCCSYGSANTKTATGYDCVKIPGASKASDGASLNAAAYGICGGEFGSIDAGIAAQTVCSKRTPFSLRFLSDLYETNTEQAKTMNGIRLAYITKAC